MSEREKGEDQKGQTSDRIYDGRNKCNFFEESIATPVFVPYYPSMQHRPDELFDWFPKEDRKTNPDKSQRCGTPHDPLDMGREVEVPCSAVDGAECSSCDG